MPQSSTLIIMINNDDSNNRTTKPTKNNLTSINRCSTTYKMDTQNNDNSFPDEWTLFTSTISKRIHSSSSEPSSPQTPSNKNKNKKLFFSTNWYEVLSQDDPQSTPTSNNNNNTFITNPIQNSIGSSNIESKVLWPPLIFVRGIKSFSGVCNELID